MKLPFLVPVGCSSTLGENRGDASEVGSPKNEKRSASAGEITITLALKSFYLALLVAATVVFFVGTMWRIIVMHPHLHREVPTTSSTKDKLKAHAPQPISHETSDDQDGHDEIEDNDKLRLPAGHHLSVDINSVDARFLDSEQLLANATKDFIDDVDETLLSYHCHRLASSGVSCVGVTTESYIAFQTWPKEGAIILDVDTRREAPLISTLPFVKNSFAIPIRERGSDQVPPPEPKMIWSHKLRGFRQEFDPDYNLFANPLEQDLTNDMLQLHGPDLKTPLVSTETDFQHVDVYELVKPNSEVDKILFLDGFSQSSLLGEAPYHEALVHPALLSHPEPKRVAIIGGGEGATLREVLKHKSVEEVVMVEIDEELVELCIEHLPEWSDCSDIAGSDEDSCFDDERVDVVFEDAFKWFVDAFGREGTDEEKFDVIIMDALDPDKLAELVHGLYEDDGFVESVFKGLTDEGVFVMQFGETDDNEDTADEVGPNKESAHMMAALLRVGFKSSHSYDEGHSKFGAPWSYLVLFKEAVTRERWYRSSAEIEVELHNRLHRTEFGEPALRFFDAPTMLNYHLPPKADETVYCRKEVTPPECKEYSSYIAGGELNRTMRDSLKAVCVPPSSLSAIDDLRQWAGHGKSSLVEDRLSSVVKYAQEHNTCKIGNDITHSDIYQRHFRRIALW